MSVVRRRASKKVVKGEPDMLSRTEFELQSRAMRIALIQRLIPLGLMAAAEELQREVAQLADKDGVYKHGSNPGTVLLGSQKVPIRVPRVRGPKGDIALESYRMLHEGIEVNDLIVSQLFGGLSCRDMEKNQLPHPGTIGKSKSTVSRKFIKASSQKVKELLDRDLTPLELVAIFVDGKFFGDCQMVIALGVTQDGHKHCLGFVETDTENRVVLTEFFKGLISRGLNFDQGILVVIDGSKGLRSAVRAVFGTMAVVQRCQWHKRENVVSYAAKEAQQGLRKRLQRAYDRPTLNEASSALDKIEAELNETNQSAARSLQEGREETLTLNRLGVQGSIGMSFRTTNCIESLNSLVEQKCGKVDHWNNSDQRQRWLSMTLLEIEPRLRKVKGFAQLGGLQKVIRGETKKNPPKI